MKRLCAVFSLSLFIGGSTIPQNPADIPHDIKRAIEKRDHSVTISELLILQKSDPRLFVADNYDYLLGRIAESDGRLALAMANYQKAVSRKSVLSIYALKHLSQIARSTGNPMLERIYLNEIEMTSAGSLLANTANLRSARNACESRNYAESLRILQSGTQAGSFSGKSDKAASMRENRALLAEAYFYAGKQQEARSVFSELISNAPNTAQPDDVSLTAARGLDLLDGGTENLGIKAPEVAEAEHLRRANIYQFNRDFADAKLHFDAVIATDPSGANTAGVIFQIGRGFAMQGDYAEAVKWFERVSEQYPESDAAKDAMPQAASAYSRLGKPQEAIQRYQQFIDKFPTDEKLDRAYLNIVDILRDQGNNADALKWCETARAVFKGKMPEAVASFTEARIHISKDEWPAALANLESLRSFPDLGGSTVPGGTDRVEVTFLKAFCLEKMDRYSEAIDVYLSIPDGRSEYFGWRSTQRLKLLATNETAKKFVAQKTEELTADLNSKDFDARRKSAQSLLRLTDTAAGREKPLIVLKAAIAGLPKYQGVPNLSVDESIVPPDAADPHMQMASVLVKLGLYDEAAPEFDAAMPNGMKTLDDKAFTLATYFKRGDWADRGLNFIEPVWKKLPVDYPIELMPQEQLELLYPAPFKDELLKYAPERGVDPLFMLAIMRQESRFQPDAKSYAAARGLMQFISTTSTKIGAEIDRENFKQDDLYYPPTAILFGSQYLRDLFEQFPGEPDAVAASYNGGDENMKRWIARSNSGNPDRYVPEIVYAQSKDYVYKVMTNYRMYKYLYNEDLELRSSR